MVMAKINYRVLLVDDDIRMLHFTRVKLMASGYDVITAITGQGALAATESRKPDIMVLDLKMPGMRGLEVLRLLRTSSKLPVTITGESVDGTKNLDIDKLDYVLKLTVLKLNQHQLIREHECRLKQCQFTAFES